jgi:hypothetical protein
MEVYRGVLPASFFILIFLEFFKSKNAVAEVGVKYPSGYCALT